MSKPDRVLSVTCSNPSSAHMLHEQTKIIISKQLLFEPYLWILGGSQIKWMVWTSHFCRPSRQVRLQNKNWTELVYIFGLMQSPVRTQFLLASASFASTLSNPFNVLFAIRTSFFLIWKSPSFSRRWSSRALQPKWTVFRNQIVRKGDLGEWFPNRFACNSC